MESFDAEAARIVMKSIGSAELTKQLEEIKISAELGNDHLFLSYQISDTTIQALRFKGFEVQKC